MIIGIIAGVIIAAGVAGIVFVNRPQFGRLPQGERLERIRKSPHYRDGQFHNLHPTVQMTAKKGRLGALWSFVFIIAGMGGQTGLNLACELYILLILSRRTASGYW